MDNYKLSQSVNFFTILFCKSQKSASKQQQHVQNAIEFPLDICRYSFLTASPLSLFFTYSRFSTLIYTESESVSLVPSFRARRVTKTNRQRKY